MWRIGAHLPDAHDREARLRYYTALSEEWPDQRSDVVLFLCMSVAGTALRLGSLGQAVNALRGVSVVRLPGFAWRHARSFWLAARRALQMRRDRRA